MNNEFEPFSFHHFAALTIFGLFTFVVIWFGWNINEQRKWQLGMGIASLGFTFMIIDLVFKWTTDTFNLLTHLPLFLCDIVIVMLPFVIWKKSLKWLGILYFWSLAGTLQALITPELAEGFPTFEFFRYFISHSGIVTAVLYCVIVFSIKIGWKDFWNAIIYVQLYLVLVHLANLILGSNYSYTVKKPWSATILDYMGPWPWYILFGEVLMIALFLLLLLPFLQFRRQKTFYNASSSGTPEAN